MTPNELETGMPAVKLMIVEDEMAVADDLRRGLEASGFAVVGQAADRETAIRLARQLTPDFVLMKVMLDGCTSGIAAGREIAEAGDAGVIFMSAQTDDRLVDDAAEAGALAFLVEPFHVPQIATAIKLAARRREDLRPLRERLRESADHPPFTAMLQRVQNLLADEKAWSTGEGLPSTVGLSVTPREREVIRGLVCYRRLARVAAVLGISIHTARNHLKSVLRKLNLHSQDELLQFLLEGSDHA